MRRTDASLYYANVEKPSRTGLLGQAEAAHQGDTKQANLTVVSLRIPQNLDILSGQPKSRQEVV